jgi:multidrug transporter EmrE-like cation transporter
VSLFFLIVAFVLTGINSISNRALIPMHLDGYRALYCIGFWGSGVVLGLITLAVSKHEVGKRDVAIGLTMGITGAVAMVLLLIALKTVPGVVAFPVRSCGNTSLTAVVSLVAWKERVTPRQWLGIACGLASIYLLV